MRMISVRASSRRAVERDPRIADEIKDELLDRIENEALVDVDGGLRLRHAPDEHGRIEPLRRDDAYGEHGRQNGDDGVLDHQRDAVAERPVGRHLMPEQLADGEQPRPANTQLPTST